MLTLLRLLLGTLVYAVIVGLAAPFPSAAGLLLVFPTLNGLGFFFSPRSDIAAMARSMLWMPVINGLLCAIYIAAILLLGDRAPTVATAWVLIAAIVTAWCWIVSRPIVRAGVADGGAQLALALLATFAGAALVWVSLEVLDAFSLLDVTDRAADVAVSRDFVGAVLWAARLKILLFAVCLAIFLVATSYLPLSPAVRGILSGLPMVPFGGLVSVAADAGVERLHILARMGASVWLGPAVAIWFVYGYAQYLLRRQPSNSRLGDSAVRFAVLVAGWLACGLVIVAIARIVEHIELIRVALG